MGDKKKQTTITFIKEMQCRHGVQFKQEGDPRDACTLYLHKLVLEEIGDPEKLEITVRGI